MTIIFERGLVLAKLEATFDTDPIPTNLLDAILVAEPDFVPDITQLQRDNVRTTFSNDAPVSGRKIGSMTFSHEVRNNGNTDASVSPILGRLLRACAMSETEVNLAAECLVNFDSSNASDSLTFACSTIPVDAYTMMRRIRVEITTGGQSGAVVAAITAKGISDAVEIRLADTDEITIVEAQEILVHDVDGTQLFGITPTFGTDEIEAGDIYLFDILPPGYSYLPESDNLASITLYMYLPDDSGESLLHKLTGGRGTFVMEANANDFARFNFTFTGTFVTVVDITTPSGTIFETQKPRQVEQAALSICENSAPFEIVNDLCASQYSIDIANEVVPRECINEPNSFQGSLIVGREPVVGFDPEAVLEAVNPFWAQLENSTQLDFRAKIGITKGNIVIFQGGNTVLSNLGYSNRNSIRSYDVAAALSAVSGDGDDELRIHFA